MYLFPNPTNGLLYIQIEATGFLNKNNEVAVKDITGRVLIQKEIDINKLNAIDLGALSSGCYFVSSTINNKVITKKILIQK